MTHARCCDCGDGSNNDQSCTGVLFPDCIEVQLSGIQSLDECDGIRFQASGFNGRFVLTKHAGNSYTGTFPAHFRVDFPDGAVSNSSEYGITVHIGCRSVDDRWGVFSAQISPINWGFFPFGVRVNAYKGDVPRFGGAAFDSPIDNEYLLLCTVHDRGMFHGGTMTVRTPDSCESLPNHVTASHCEHLLPPIVVDLDTLPGAASDRTPIMGDELYKLGANRVTDPADAHGWTAQTCGTVSGSDNRIATRCNGQDQIVYDPSKMQGFAATCLFEGNRYELTAETTLSDAVDVTFDTRNCDGIDIPNCSDILDPDDPRCEVLFWYDCPACENAPIRPRPIGDPITRPGGSKLPVRPIDSVPQVGNILESIIKATRLDKLARPDKCSCQRRKEILNDYGERVGRMIINALKL